MLSAKDIMTTEVITVTSNLAVEELAAILFENKISGVPVVDDNKLVGVVTESDLIDQKKRVHIPTMISFLDSVIMLDGSDSVEQEIRKMTGSVVSDICSSKLITVTPETPLDSIATIMADRNIHTLPVVENEKLVGVIGKADVIKTIINSPGA
jgi:CBS domain-containing protein